MTNAAVVVRKLSLLADHTARLERRRPPARADFESIDVQDATAMSLLVCVQEAADIALHIASDEGWGVAASYTESFEILAQRGVIDAELARELSRMVALRNRIAHAYASVDADRIYDELPSGIDAFRRFSAAIARHLGTGA